MIIITIHRLTIETIIHQTKPSLFVFSFLCYTVPDIFSNIIIVYDMFTTMHVEQDCQNGKSIIIIAYPV